MSWKSKEDKERFFEDLEIAFNTPASQNLILPKVKNKPPIQQPSDLLPKRQTSTCKPNDAKRQKVSINHGSTTGVGIRRIVHEKPKRPLPVKRRPSGARKLQSDTIVKLSELLSGMVLFFIPNSKKNGIRRFRMTLFAQHGADVRGVWSDEITHIICDKSINGERVMREMRWEQFPV